MEKIKETLSSAITNMQDDEECLRESMKDYNVAADAFRKELERMIDAQEINLPDGKHTLELDYKRYVTITVNAGTISRMAHAEVKSLDSLKIEN